MDFYKLDRFDKIVISMIFIIGALISFFNNIVFASSEVVDFNVVSGVGINVTANVVSNSAPDSIGYFEIEPGYIYTVSRDDGGIFKCGFSNEIPVSGVSLENVKFGLKSFTFSSSDYNYFYFNFGTIDAQYSVTREFSQSLDGVISNLSDNVSGQLIWDSIVSAIPFIFVCSVFGLGSVFIHRLIKSGSIGKAKLF